NSTWSEGDWTCDGDFDTDDLVAAFQAGYYELPPAAVAVIRSFDDVEQSTLRASDNHGARMHPTIRAIAGRSKWLDKETVASMYDEGVDRGRTRHVLHDGAVDRLVVDLDLELDELVI
ncbi:MAG: hypothetical protein KDB27_29185, partial [Planctomycetales bacterium]|nr:hypothetical protein [Planctomycetales bacterium]